MSTTSPSPPLTFSTTPPPPPPPSPPNYLTNLGLGYAIAIALGFLVLLSTLLLASYICCRLTGHRTRRHQHHNSPSRAVAGDGVVLPRIIFVAEDDDDAGGSESGGVGLDPAVINSYPRFPFTKGGNDPVCPICLCEYKENEMLRMLPDCKHYFHLSCIDAWLKLNASCPVCRNSPLPTPLSTPLSEVVPLSQYSDGRRRWRHLIVDSSRVIEMNSW